MADKCEANDPVFCYIDAVICLKSMLFAQMRILQGEGHGLRDTEGWRRRGLQLLKMNDAYYAGECENLVFGKVEGVVVDVVGYGKEAVVIQALA